MAKKKRKRRSGKPKKLRALSIRQPFAEMIMTGEKDIEYRSWPVRLRETVYVYACKTPGDPEDYDEYGYSMEDLPHGVIVGTVEIADCTVNEEYGVFEWHLRNPKRFRKPLPIRAMPQPGFFWPFGR